MSMNKHPILMSILLWLAFYFIISLCWVGAEYVFEGVVHTSSIDGYFACLLALEYTKEAKRYAG